MNGWTNWKTWNIAMWIANDEMLNRMMTLSAKGDWDIFKTLAMNFGITQTPDSVSFEDPEVNQTELRNTHLSDQEDSNEEECSVLEGRRLLKQRSFYI